MNPTNPTRPSLRPLHIVALTGLFLLIAGVVGVAGYFRLSSETTLLRQSVMKSVPGPWDKRFAARLGSLTLCAVRLGAHWAHLPSEARAGLAALRGVDVGVYQLQREPGAPDCGAVFQAADEVMTRRGWERVLGVAQPTGVVGIYLPRKGVSCSAMRCCLLVLEERNLVVASARGNLEPLLAMAQQHIEQSGMPFALTKCRVSRPAAASN